MWQLQAMNARADSPDVQVVDGFDAGDAAYRSLHRFHIQALAVCLPAGR
jgi:hypothetical protein